MKHTALITYSLFLLTSISVSAAVPLRWTVETSRATPAQFEAYQGETLALEATLQSHGKPLEMSGIAALYWQTNGMGSTYWQTTAAVNSNRLSAVFTPEMDVGAKVYNCFIGQPGKIYHAVFQLRLRPSPGATPNVLPLPTPVIDFAKVTVLNPPWGSGGGTGTNDVIAIIHKTVDGSARALPKYLHALDFSDSYPEDAARYYQQRGSGVPAASCSSVRNGGFLYRNFDFPFDDRAEFVVHMSSGPARFASVGVAQVGTNLTKQIVTSGKPSRWYKALPGATVDGINEHGVVAEINVVDGDPQTSGWHTNATSEAIHPLGAIRWTLDHATNAQHAATYLAANIRFPQGWTQNYHYMIADETNTYIVENGAALDADEFHEPDEPATMTNFPLNRFPWEGMGMERFGLLLGGEPITNAWFTRAYSRSTTPPWVSDLRDVLAYSNEIFDAWASHPKEYFRGKTTNGQPWWQTVHTSIYDITNRVLRVAVQETDDFYTFQVPASGGGTWKVREIAGEIVAPVASSVSGLQSSKADRPDSPTSGNIASLTADGDLEDGGIAKTNVATKTETYTRDASDGRFLGYSQSSDYDPLSQFSIFTKLGGIYGTTLTFTYDSGALFLPGWWTESFHVKGARILTDRYDHYAEFENGRLKYKRYPETSYSQTFAFLSDIPPPYTPSATDPAFSNAVKKVMEIRDETQNLKYTITGDDNRFYFEPIGAINPED